MHNNCHLCQFVEICSVEHVECECEGRSFKRVLSPFSENKKRIKFKFIIGKEFVDFLNVENCGHRAR